MGRPGVAAGGWEQHLARELDARDEGRARRVVGRLVDDPEAREGLLHVLATRAARGSPLAVQLLTEVVDELGLARSAVRRTLADHAAVDDVTQDTLISMTSSIPSFRGEARFTTWLHQIARNRVVDHLRRSQAVEPLDESDIGEARRISSLIARREAMRQIVDRLPDHYRTAVVLRDIERLPYAEIAAQLALNVNTVKSHVARGRALMGAMMQTERDAW